MLSLYTSLLPYIWKFALAGAVIAGSWYAVYTWHYGPLNSQANEIVTLRSVSASKDTTINDLGTQIQYLIEHNKVVGYEEFYKGYKDENISVTYSRRFSF